jgi:hypothetical protein
MRSIYQVLRQANGHITKQTYERIADLMAAQARYWPDIKRSDGDLHDRRIDEADLIRNSQVRRFNQPVVYFRSPAMSRIPQAVRPNLLFPPKANIELTFQSSEETDLFEKSVSSFTKNRRSRLQARPAGDRHPDKAKYPDHKLYLICLRMTERSTPGFTRSTVNSTQEADD